MLRYRATARGHTVPSGEIAGSHPQQPGEWHCVQLVEPALRRVSVPNLVIVLRDGHQVAARRAGRGLP